MKIESKNKWLRANDICIAHGSAVALNLMFETKKDHQRFLDLWDKYLGGMAKLIQYHLAPTGWTMLFRTKTKQEIMEAYKKQRRLSKKAKKEKVLKDAGKMLSEHFRIFLSQYVRKTNATKGRKGTLVMERFGKMVLDREVDFVEIFKRLTSLVHRNAQSRKRYQADESKYDEAKELEHKSEWIVGNRRFWKMADLLIGDRGDRLNTHLEGEFTSAITSNENSVLRKFWKKLKKLNSAIPDT